MSRARVSASAALYREARTVTGHRKQHGFLLTLQTGITFCASFFKLAWIGHFVCERVLNHRCLRDCGGGGQPASALDDSMRPDAAWGLKIFSGPRLQNKSSLEFGSALHFVPRPHGQAVDLGFATPVSTLSPL